MENKNIELKIDDSKGRIDKYLSERLPDMSRSKIQKLIKDKNILVNNKTIKANYKLEKNDEIKISIPEPKSVDMKAENIPLDVIFEDKDIAIINKKQGIVVHPGAGNWDGTLVNALLYHIDDLSGINGEIRPGVVHRLDKDTSGILVIAKNDQAHIALSEQFQNRTIKRTYRAIVHGVPNHKQGTIKAPIGRDLNNRQQFTVTSNGKEAISHFKVIEGFKDFSLLEVDLETGRTHQIRVHLKYINHPVAGDLVYGTKNTLDSKGQFLHAYSLEFLHPRTAETMYFEAPYPTFFSEALNKLQKD